MYYVLDTISQVDLMVKTSLANPVYENGDEVCNGAGHVSFASEVVAEQHITGSESAFVAVAGRDLGLTRQDDADVRLGRIVGRHVGPSGH